MGPPEVQVGSCTLSANYNRDRIILCKIGFIPLQRLPHYSNLNSAKVNLLRSP